jgi:uncharacterized membrane protein
MLKYLIQVVQNSLSGGILTALLCALLLREGDAGRKRLLVWWCAGGSAAALIVAILRRATRLINREYINTGVLPAAIIAGIFFILLFWGSFRKKWDTRLDWTGSALAGLLLFYTLPTLFLYPAEFALPGESVFSTAFLFNAIGFAAGLLLVFLSALALFKAAGALPRNPGGIILSAALIINLVNQLSAILQFLIARRIVSVPRRVFRLIVRIINYNDVFLYLIMAVSFALPLILFVRSLRPAVSWRNSAELRKIKAGRRLQRRWSAVVLCGFAAAVLTLTVVKDYHGRGVELTPAEPMTIADNEILIPLEHIEDGHLHRFNYTASENIEMRFIVIKKNESSYGVGLDACDICGPTGYYERKDQVICKLCDVVMNISTIGFKGGCNPVPLAYTVRGGVMVIDTENLEAERLRFK